MYLWKLSLASSGSGHLPSVGWGQEERVRILSLGGISVNMVISQFGNEEGLAWAYINASLTAYFPQWGSLGILEMEQQKCVHGNKNCLSMWDPMTNGLRLQGFLLLLTLLNPLCWFLIDPGKGGKNKAAIHFLLRALPIEYCILQVFCICVCKSSGNRCQKWQSEILGRHFTNIPNQILFSNRAPSQRSWGKGDTFFVGDCLYNFFQL